MKAKDMVLRGIDRFFHYIDVGVAWLFHLPKPFDWEKFDRDLKEAIEQDKINTERMLKEAKRAGIQEVVDWIEGILCEVEGTYVFYPEDWQKQLKEWDV